ncbi:MULTISPECIES: Ger(x)C family spore germination protein [unclassified Paenibacillus]|uniref:Ger(x)C family spore germination protein n=1 Tax=unclassified Paenibacillus TaxID=185978 RepID=UPI000954AC2C|nr:MULTISPECIES: Ger(x)C family spore germination protein [unclassified Paenibacillus]ASS64823.2 Ger(x)C family spore germination protein [Paenibacillus sp. RUD330]SIR04861.1 germination protein, Ger(x)C family [Paenibacillus sp. RU4X]SIR30458.1 germination protein, Ger(x)C family [Paenibacillus sp. RU4T]
MRARLLLGMLAALSMLIAGCWDEVDLTDQGYVSAMGIDYADGNYTMTVQLMQFSSVAKSQDSGSSSGSSIWLGTGTGKTMLMALGDLQRSAQFEVNLDHMKVLVVQERALSHVDDILDANNRQRASRYTSLVFATREPFEKLFNTNTFFGRSPLMSIMYNPRAQFKQNSLIRPVTMQELVKALDEPGFTAVLPVIGIDETDWNESKSKMMVQRYDGVIPFYMKKAKPFLSVDEISGMRWIDPTFHQHYIYTGMKADENGRKQENIATVNMTYSKPSYHLVKGGAIPEIKLDVNVKGHLIELTGPMTEREITREVEQKVKAEIERTYRIGCSKKVDILQLEEVLYRNHNKLWKQLAHSGEWHPLSEQLKVFVHFDLVHTGKFDLT